MEDASRAHANALTLQSIKSMPVEELDSFRRPHVEETSSYLKFLRTQNELTLDKSVVHEGYDDRLLGNVWDEISEHEVWLTYHEDDRDAVEITRNDMESIQPGRFLRGNIIDFYIRYLWVELCDLGEYPIHFFNCFFFTQLADNDGASTESEQRKTAFEKVQKWTRGVDIFDMEYVFIPVNQSSHWSLIIICNLRSLTSSPDEPECLPLILHLDSVKGKHGNLEGHIRSYIVHALMERYHVLNGNQLLALSQMTYEEVEVRQQDNHYDCGIYLLHFVDLFLNNTEVSSELSLGVLYTELWNASEVSAKRRDIRNLILELSLAARRELRDRKRFLRHYELVDKPVSQICEVFETRLDGDEGRIEDPLDNELKQSNVGVGESKCADHRTAGEVATDNQQYTEIEHIRHQSTGEIVLDDQLQQREQSPCTKSKSVKERNKRYIWSRAETSILLDCKKEGGRYCKGKQAYTDWIAISQEIENKNGTRPSGDQCRLRYDTLLKAYRSSKDYCMTNSKQFAEELCRDELKLSTNLTVDWYNTIAEICRLSPQKERSAKRVKFRS